MESKFKKRKRDGFDTDDVAEEELPIAKRGKWEKGEAEGKAEGKAEGEGGEKTEKEEKGEEGGEDGPRTFSIRMVHPFSMLLVGPSSSGKTTYVTKLLKNLDAMVDGEIQKVIWVYKIYQPLYDSVSPDVEFRKSISEDDLSKSALNHKRTLLILDDVYQVGRYVGCSLGQSISRSVHPFVFLLSD